MSVPILPGAPWLIAHKSMLGVNKPNKITLNGKDYVLWQNQKGEVFALNNICPHMQAPLSEGWVCQERNTITCPFHALEFDGNGRLCKEEKVDTKPLTQSLELIIKDDCIWTYGGFEPRLPVPDLISKIASEYELIGVTGEKSIQGDFLSNILINYDYNHLNGTHKEMFRITSCQVKSFEEKGYSARVEQEIIRANNTVAEIIRNPALLVIPKKMNNTVEYSFPSTTVIFGKSPILSLAEVHILYPETENKTKTFVLLYSNFKNPIFGSIFKTSLLPTIGKIVEQDSTTIESLYPREKPKIRLLGEEVLLYAEKLYCYW